MIKKSGGLSRILYNSQLVGSLRSFVESTKKESENISNVNKDKNEPNPVGLDQKMEDHKGKKHIYKPNEETEYDIVGSRNSAYREGYEDGVYMQQRMSFAYYEVIPRGAKSQSGGKSEETMKEKDKTVTEKGEAEKTQTNNPKDKKSEMPEGNKKI